MVPQSVRIRFRKTGRLKYISHLDLCRTMCPAMIRAKIPLWYTEGFNPHPKLVFAQPLPLFAESTCEYLDIKIVEDISMEELCVRLRSAFTEELYIEEVYVPEVKFSEIVYAGYRLTGFVGMTQEKLDAVLSGALNVTKKTKSGELKETDIRPQIKSMEIQPNGEIFAVLNASGTSYLNPDLLCNALDPDGEHGITRVEWYKADGSLFR